MSERDFHLVGWESLKVYSLRLIARLSVCIPQMELTSAQSPTNAPIYILMFIPKLRAVLLMVCPIRLLENRPYPDKSKEYRLVAITMKVHHRISFIITRVDSSQLIASLLFTHSSSQWLSWFCVITEYWLKKYSKGGCGYVLSCRNCPWISPVELVSKKIGERVVSSVFYKLA